MKTSLIFIFSLILSLNLFAQPQFNAPFGLKFGTSIDSVKKVIDSRSPILIATKDTEFGKILCYSNIKIGTLKADLCFFKFVNNQMFEVSMQFFPIDSLEIENKYDAICKIISNKYGEGTSIRDFKDPYKDNKDNKDNKNDLMLALKGGYANIVTYWTKFQNNEGAIGVKIDNSTKKLNVILRYQHNALFELSKKKDEAALNYSDF